MIKVDYFHLLGELSSVVDVPAGADQTEQPQSQAGKS